MPTERGKLLELAKRCEAAKREDNSLDVLCEVALFKPSGMFIAARANNAGTKVIYTDIVGNNVTCWAEPWSTHEETPARLRARATEGTDAPDA